MNYICNFESEPKETECYEAIWSQGWSCKKCQTKCYRQGWSKPMVDDDNKRLVAIKRNP